MASVDDGHMIDHMTVFRSRGPLLHLSMARASRVQPSGVPDEHTNMMDPFDDGAVNEPSGDDLLGG